MARGDKPEVGGLHLRRRRRLRFRGASPGRCPVDERAGIMRFGFHHRWHRGYDDYDRYYGGYGDYGDYYDAGYYTPWNDWQSRTWAIQSYMD
jgi:hypothetical protein